MTGEIRAERLVLAVTLLMACGDNLDSPFDDTDTEIPAPTRVTASDGTSIDLVTLTWTPVAQATSYRIWRDGAVIAHVTAPPYEDRLAGAGSFQTPVLSATSGKYFDRVLLVWSPPRGGAGQTHLYSVTAVASHGRESERSQEDAGFRGEPEFIRWEVSPDAGQTFPFIATNNVYSDLTAPAGTVIPGVVTASDGTFDTHIAVSIAGTTAVNGSVVHYVVRAITTGPPVSSNFADGYRGVDNLRYQWHRYLSSLGPESAVMISNATSLSFDDSSVQPSEMYEYYCTISALHAEPMTVSAAPDVGWRAP